MTYDLLVWKSPVVSDQDVARAMVDVWLADERGPFEASGDVSRFYDALLAKYPPLESLTQELHDTSRSSPWAQTPERSDRVVAMSFVWSVPGEVIDDVFALAREHGLVLYDPQGPDIHLPGGSDEAARREGFTWATLVGIAGALLAIVAWRLSIPILSGVLVVVGAALALMAIATVIHVARESLAARS
jgi:hypothetical protein